MLAFIALLFSASPSAPPAGTTFCCGIGAGAACSGPDWTTLYFAFNKDASQVDVNITIDSTATFCRLENSNVTGTTVNFPSLANKTDCLGQLISGTGALLTDLVVTIDPSKDTIEVAVDSEGVDEVLQPC